MTNSTYTDYANQGDRISADILGVLWAIARRPLGPREVCTRCGCLCLAWEHCPGCKAGLHRRQVQLPTPRSVTPTCRREESQAS